jgi:hypothetical protein
VEQSQRWLLLFEFPIYLHGLSEQNLAANAHIIGFPVGLTPGLTRGEIPKMQGVAVKFSL